MTEAKIIKIRGGRTGQKIHYAFDGGSSTMCGIWLKANVRYFKVSDLTKITCDKCQLYSGQEQYLKG